MTSRTRTRGGAALAAAALALALTGIGAGAAAAQETAPAKPAPPDAPATAPAKPAEPVKPAPRPAPKPAPPPKSTPAATTPARPAAPPTLNTNRPAALLPGLGHLHHPITARVPDAQSFFDQGLLLGFAFNEEEAVRSFKRAAAIDSQAAMALWGVAWALGPGIDRPRDPERDGLATEAIAKAGTLTKGATDLERAYVEAMARRYSADPKADPAALDAAYRDAMRDLVARWPDDIDAALLYAESLLAMHPSQEWWHDGAPSPETGVALGVIETLLRRAPEHPGVNRDAILALEASPYPERALPSAGRLETLVPLAGGLLITPAGLYMRTGDYAAAATACEKAIEADTALFRDFGLTPLYPVLRAPRAHQSLAAARLLEGRGLDAVRAAQEARAGLAEALALSPLPKGLVPILETRWASPLFVALRFHKWEEILKDPEPDPRLLVSAALRHAGRAIACAGKRDWECAQAEKTAFNEARGRVPAETLFGANQAQDVLNVAGFVTDGRMLEAHGRREDAIGSWQSAVQAQDALAHEVPSAWYDPLRESLGGVLLRSGRATEAEKIFREDLDRHPRNGRSLFGLYKSLEAQKKIDAAALVKAQFDAAWKDADVTLKVDDL
jgi:tetratricopeptide (TPR) repeat protein